MKGLVLTYLVTALASAGALRRPLIGLYAYVGFAVLRPQFIFGWAGDMANVSLILGIALLAGWVLNGLGDWGIGRSKPVAYALFAFTGFYAISALFAERTDVAFAALLELLKIVLPFCVGLTMMRDERDWRRLMWVIVLAMGYVGAEQNLNYLRGNNTAAVGFGGMDNNCFGVELVTVLGLAVALLLTTRKWYERATAAACAGLILHTTLLTFSRGAMVGLLAVGTTAFFALPKRPKYIAVMLVVGLVAMRLTGPELMARYATVFASEEDRDASAQSRLDLWMDTIQVIASRPLLGVGPANWNYVASSFGWAEGKSAHSVWMETAADVGVPGTLSLFLFFALAAFRLWPLARARLTDTNRSQVGGAMGVVLGVAGFIASGQFVSVVGLEAPYYIVMLGVAVLRATSARTFIVTAPAVVPLATSERVRTVRTATSTKPQRLLPALDSATARPRLLPELHPRGK